MWLRCLVLLILNVVLCYTASNSTQPLAKEFLRKAARGAIMQKYMNRAVDPCDNFYEFACGNWPRLDPRKKEIASYSAFSNVEDKITEYIVQLLSESENPDNSTEENVDDPDRKARSFYQSCVHSNIFQFRKVDTYVNLLKSIGGFPALDPDWHAEQFDWVKMIAHARSYGIDVLIYQLVSSDENGTFIYLSNADVGLLPISSEDEEGSRPYVINELLIKKILTIYGVPKRRASKLAMNIINFMKKIFAAQDVEENVGDIDTPWNTAQFIDWDEYFNISGRILDNNTEAGLYSSKYTRRLHSLILRSDFQTVANYIAVKILFDLHPEFSNKKYLRQVCATLTHEYLEPIVNSMYIEKYYDKGTENDIFEMIADIKEAFRKILNESEWLDEVTKQKAIVKLNAMKTEVGLAEYILSKEQLAIKYKDLNIHPTNYYENNLRYRFYENLQENVPKPTAVTTKKPQLDVTTVQVNAFYEVENNMMVIPAGIMLPPFYHRDLPKAYSYGIIGSVLGHEITHGFDDTGKDYDSEGNEVNWWSRASKRAYLKRSKCMIKQYNNYTMADLNKNVDGEATLGENIADNGGVRESYYAYKMWYDRNSKGGVINSERLSPTFNMTNTQLFFLSFAQGYCDHLVQNDLKSYLEDEHAMGRYRIIGTLSNFEEFAKEFNCPVGSNMNPIQKCRVW